MSNEVENTGKILIYQNEKGDTKIDVYFEEDTIWMTQKAMCELYQVAKSSVSEHISNIFKDGELEPEATVRKFRTVQIEGTRQVTRERDYYNLDMILAVGYRVRSNVGIHFRRWASGVLTEYMKKGFALNDERLRNPREFGADYFDELLERIRDIRASEKRVYQKVKEIFALSVDYDSKSQVAQNFFKSVQNKLEYAATGHTAPELIANRADAFKDNMAVLSSTQDRGIVPRDEVDIDIKYDACSLVNYKKVSKGNFVISLRSFQGGIEYSTYTGLVSPAYTVLSSRKEISDGYYKQFFKSTDYINRLNVAVYGIRDGKQISYEDFGRLRIPYPPIKEQDAIAEVLSAADREIDLLQQDIEQEKQKKKALMQLLLTGIVRVKT